MRVTVGIKKISEEVIRAGDDVQLYVLCGDYLQQVKRVYYAAERNAVIIETGEGVK